MLGDIKTAFWLKTRHFALPKSVVILILSGWALYILLIAASAQLMYISGGFPAGFILGLLTLTWLLWALLPAFGGGGEMDQTRYLDVYPIRKTFLVASGIFAVLLDLQYLIVMPVLLACAYSSWGFKGLILTFLFVVGAGAIGQLCIWLVTSFPKQQWITMSILAATLVIAAKVLRSNAYYGPPGWLLGAVQNSGAVSWSYTTALFAPILLFAFSIKYLAHQTTLSRGEKAGATRRIIGYGGISVIFKTHLYSIWRSNTAKVMLFSCLVIPLIVGTVLPDMTASTIVAFVIAAGGATCATNSYAYDHTGTLALLAWPVSRRKLLWFKFCAVFTWFILLAIPATVMSLAMGLTVGASVFGFITTVVLFAFIATLAGMGTSVRRPCEADHEMMRVRPAPILSVFGYGLRLLVFLGLLAAIREGLYASPVLIGCTIILCCLTFLIIWRTYRAFLDSSALCGAFKV